jgi:hypothetical protein
LEIPTEITEDQHFQSTVLWPALFAAYPKWRHGIQGTGDCVSWMLAHMADISDAIRNLGNPRKTELLQTASESIYGFGKSELANNYRFHSAGMMGIDAIKAAEKFGRLLRKKYEQDDLTAYSGELAQSWAERPHKTHGVPDYLEPEATKHKVRAHLEVKETMTAAAFIEAGYPVGYCGDTSWGIVTDAQGIAQKFNNGAHAMALTGVMYAGKQPAFFWVANTGHGDHVHYRGDRSEVPVNYTNCGCWIPQRFIEPVLQRGDCFVISIDNQWNIHNLLPLCTDPNALV